MSKKTSYLLGILLTIVLGTILQYFLCCNLCSADSCDKNKNNIALPSNKKVTRNAFFISDANGDFKIKIDDNFNFKNSNFKILEPISEEISGGILKIRDYLGENPLKDLQITGYYRSDEINNSAYPNLGLARANSVKNYLVKNGIPAKQIDTKGELKDDINPDDAGTLFGPLQFWVLTFKEGDTSALDAIKLTCDDIKKNPLVLYFKTGQAKINLTVEQRQKMAAISRCVDKFGVKVQVVGHTDNTGQADNNLVLGQNRADFAKKYLINNGILEENIEATSKGQQQPIADNATEEGKAKNRRTVITIN